MSLRTEMKWHDGALLATLAVGGVLGLVYVAVGKEGLEGFILHPATAAWVQAIGSILALAIAIALGRHQTRSAERLETRRRLDLDRRMMETISTVAAAGSDMCKLFRSDWVDERMSAVPSLSMLEEVRDVRELLSKVDPLALPVASVGYQLLRLPRLLTDLETSARGMETAFGNPEGQFDAAYLALRTAISRTHRCFRVTKMLSDRFLRESGAESSKTEQA